MNGIILAGGQATRLGIIGAQLNKSLVSIGQKPTIVRQVQQLLEIGCAPITIVVSPRTAQQVDEVLEQCGLPACRIATQISPTGPGGALNIGSQKLKGSAVLLMADTLLSDEDMAKLKEPDTAAVMPAPSQRSWTYWDDDEGRWVEGVSGSHIVSVGAFHFADVRHLHETCSIQTGIEIKMAAVCNAYGEMKHVFTESWQDIGDLEALANAQRQRFISRGKHKMQLDDRGVLVKEGASTPEALAVAHPPLTARHLYPTVYRSSAKVSLMHAPATYEMEYVDVPSLTEQWLYWPGLPETWSYITTSLIEQMQMYHWSRDDFRPGLSRGLKERAEAMYITKLQKRYDKVTPSVVPPWSKSPQIFVNGRPALGGPALIDEVCETMSHFVETSPDFGGTIHGDLYFGNVLWSARTGIFKLLDPRGAWGGIRSIGSLGDIRYDLAKIGFSPLLAPIGHHLFVTHTDGERGWNLFAWPERDEEIDAVDDAVVASVEGFSHAELEVMKVYLCLSSAPLHEPREATALYLTAVERWASLSR